MYVWLKAAYYVRNAWIQESNTMNIDVSNVMQLEKQRRIEIESNETPIHFPTRFQLI